MDILLLETVHSRTWESACRYATRLRRKRRIGKKLVVTNVTDEKQQLHTLVDLLAPVQVHALRGLIEVMLDPLSRKFAIAPIEDEEIGEEEESAVAESKEWLKHNKPIPHEEVLARFGLTMDDFRKLGETPLPPESRGNG